MVWAVSTLHSPLRPAAAGEEGWLGEAQSASTPCPFLALPSSSPLAPAARTCERACCCCEPRSDRPRLAAPFPPPIPSPIPFPSGARDYLFPLPRSPLLVVAAAP